jgi:adenylate cyclase
MNACTKTCKTSLFFLLIGISLAFFSLTQKGIYLEEEFGLPLLFKLRGPIPVPENIIIISIDELSAQVLRLPDNPEKWPRSYYAQLINKINLHNPAIIAFNMTFDEKREPKNDQLLAEAMARNNNIILSNYLKRQTLQSTGSLSKFRIDRIINPIPALEQAALDIAPFLLPRTSTTVKQFWAYKNSAGDIATFPASVFQCFIFKHAYTEILQISHQIKPDHTPLFPSEFKHSVANLNSINIIQTIQSIVGSNQQTLEQAKHFVQAANFSANKKRLLNAWLGLLNKPGHLYFNYYGSAESITTIPFYQALLSDILSPDLFHNKIVLVGYSKTIEPEKATGLYTVFSNTDNDITSPIEIAATAVANLIEDTWLKPLEPLTQFLLLLGWSVILCALPRLFSYKQVIGLMISLTLAYIAIAYTLFVTNSIWIPLFFPVIIQAPLILSFISVFYFLKGSKDRNKMQQAFSLYIPDNVVTSITQDHDINALNHFGELMHGVCMATDAGQYTTLSENMDPLKLHSLINDYYAVMFPLVQQNKGIISDVVGDAMFAIWNNSEIEIQARTNACSAALEIKSAVDQFNHAQPYQMYTRLGLHFGNIRLGNVGAANHYEYRAVGDTVNTAARIEGLNKLLGTQILVTAEVIKDLADFFTRELGFFILKGKTQPVHIYELIGRIEQHNTQGHPVTAEFSKVLILFQQQQWTKALAAWEDLDLTYPGDGPTLFYINYIKQTLKQDNKNLSTVIKIGENTPALH